MSTRISVALAAILACMIGSVSVGTATALEAEPHANVDTVAVAPASAVPAPDSKFRLERESTSTRFIVRLGTGLYAQLRSGKVTVRDLSGRQETLPSTVLKGTTRYAVTYSLSGRLPGAAGNYSTVIYKYARNGTAPSPIILGAPVTNGATVAISPFFCLLRESMQGFSIGLVGGAVTGFWTGGVAPIAGGIGGLIKGLLWGIDKC